jgi:predicted CXXCH cytochrome family protein
MARRTFQSVLKRTPRILWLGCLGVVGSLLVLTNCRDTEQRHDVLSFFFDGVPPWDEQAAGRAGFLEGQDPRRRAETVWTLHEPLNDCARCHGEQQQKNFSREVKLVAPVPDLCYQCHTGPTALTGWVHGPVITGDCLLCHEPHRTVNPYLLRRAIPEICYQCHDPASIRSITDHELPGYSLCDACHSGHASPERFLLKQGPTLEALTTFRGEFDQARSDIEAGQSLETLLAAVTMLVDQGQPARARAYLLGIKFHATYDDAGRQAIEERLARIHAEQTARREQARAQHQAAQRQVAERYYRSLQDYQAGRWHQAQKGFYEVIENDLTPPAIARAIQGYLADIDNRLGQGRESMIPPEP